MLPNLIPNNTMPPVESPPPREEPPIIDHLPDGGIAAIERSPDGRKIYIVDLVFDRYDCPPHLQKYVPAIDPDFTYDRASVEMLYAVANAEEHAYPLLLDGAPGTTKTASVQHFYALLNRPVYRFNCRGQTDTSELIGRFLPNEDEGAEWRWLDGAVPFCMKEGVVLLLDEVDLAKQEVLQGATNSVLEEDPKLTIPEHRGETIRRRKPRDSTPNPEHVHDLHEQFRIYGTRNPLDPSREPFGEPYKDRWIGRKVSENPTEDDIAQRSLRRLYREQPAITFRGKHYTGSRTELPPRKEYRSPDNPAASGTTVLSAIPNFRAFAALHAEFHQRMVEAAQLREIGGAGLDAHEGLIFSQRSSSALFTFLEERKTFNRWTNETLTTKDDPTAAILTGLDLLYRQRCAEKGDREKVVDILTLLGLSLENFQWKPEEGYRYIHEREPARFLQGCFAYMEANQDHTLQMGTPAASADDAWVNMNMVQAADRLPARSFDHHRTAQKTPTGFDLNTGSGSVAFEPAKTFATLDELLKSLKGKTVLSVLFEIEQQRHWFLQCLGNTAPAATPAP